PRHRLGGHVARRRNALPAHRSRHPRAPPPPRPPAPAAVPRTGPCFRHCRPCSVGTGVTSPPTPHRFAEFDGLRGWAALSVVFFPLTWETFGVRFPIFRTYPVSLLGNGTFAVAIFFAISGFVLTVGRWNRDDNPNLPLVL